MNRPVVVVGPLSAGVELAPAFRARGVPAIAVTIRPRSSIGFGGTMNPSDFIEIIPEQDNLVDILKKYNPIAIIPGTEDAVPLADTLTEALVPERANIPEKALHRTHKAWMQQALDEAGVPVLKTLNTSSEKEVEAWIKVNNFANAPLIMKPPISVGSDNVFHICENEDWTKAFNTILASPSGLTGETNQSVVVQEYAAGTEFAVGTVSANGQHYLAHLIKYNKTTFNGRQTVYDHVEFIDYDRAICGDLLEYTKQALDALGVRWGATHTEIILTQNGPRLIETGARMCGGPVVGFAREATGSSQADKLVEIYLDGDVKTKEYVFKKTVVPVFLKSPANGKISNIEALADTTKLPTFFFQHIGAKNGDIVPQTVDYLTNIGIIALTGDRKSILLDYQKIRNMESKLIVEAL